MGLVTFGLGTPGLQATPGHLGPASMWDRRLERAVCPTFLFSRQVLAGRALLGVGTLGLGTPGLQAAPTIQGHPGNSVARRRPGFLWRLRLGTLRLGTLRLGTLRLCTLRLGTRGLYTHKVRYSWVRYH